MNKIPQEEHQSSKLRRVESLGTLYVILLIGYMAADYSSFVFLTIYDRMGFQLKSIILLAIFHVAFVMFVWSYMATACSDPGYVRPHYGYYGNSTQQDGQRYCHRCNMFKPERAHHCSLCKRCVLNMDHHCPWISNCVGFYNKKLFILVLFYGNISLFIGLIGSSYEIYSILSGIFGGDPTKAAGIKEYLILASFSARLVMFIVLALFFRYHLNLIDRNITTLENLDIRRGRIPPSYDVGVDMNRSQVFGRNSSIWCCPFFTKSSLPNGDGYTWSKPGVPLESMMGADDQGSPFRRGMSPSRHGDAVSMNGGFPGPGVVGSSYGYGGA